MKPSLLLFFFSLCFAAGSWGQTKDTTRITEPLITPEVFAEFQGGEKAFMNYLMENVMNKISSKELEIIPQKVFAKFTVSETGTIKDVSIARTSNSSYIDSLFVKALEDMPQWKPASINQKNTEQEFVVPMNICVE